MSGLDARQQERQTVCIIGFGRFGETLAGVLRNSFTVVVMDNDPDRTARAQELGYKTAGLQDIATLQTIIACVPISQFQGMIEIIKPYLKPGTLVMDVCSVKVFPVRVMQDSLPQSVAIIATHPMFGPDSIRKGLNNLSIVVCPVRVTQEISDQWVGFWEGAGLRVIVTTPEVHDQMTVYTQGMTHFFGRIMGELNIKPQAIETMGYKALYEVMEQTCRDSWQLFHDMQHYNPYAKEMRDEVYKAIQTVEAKLDEAIDEAIPH